MRDTIAWNWDVWHSLAMSSDLIHGAGTLLTALIQVTNANTSTAGLLHEDVTLHRLDGTSVSGRSAVADAICSHGSEARFRVVGRYAETVQMAIEIDGLPGHLRCILSGVVRDGLLTEIWMNAT